MKTKIITLVCALILTVPAFAEFTLITEGYEVVLSDVRLPRNAGGSISFKRCDDCDYETHIASTDMLWQINDITRFRSIPHNVSIFIIFLSQYQTCS